MTKTPFEMMMDQANEMAKAMAPALETFSPKGFEAMWPTMSKEMMEATFGKGLNENGLKMLILPAVSLSSQRLELGVRRFKFMQEKNS